MLSVWDQYSITWRTESYWAVGNYTVTNDSDWPLTEVLSVQKYSTGDTIVPPTLPSKTGLTGNWVNVPSTMPARNIEIIGQYTPITYSIKYYDQGTLFLDTT